ncbi:MAG: dihydrodipicolinate synthase family protein [Acidobacteriaceae bacterium]
MVILDRREFLKTGALLGAATVFPKELMGAARNRTAPTEFKQRLRGPIVSIPTPFTSEMQLDRAGLHRMIKMGLENQIDIFELTAGDSQYSFLAYDEIKSLAQIVADSVGDRGVSIIGTGPWWTERTIDFAHHVESMGGTALQVLKPTGAADDQVVEHYRRVAEATRLPIVLHGNFPMPLLEKLVQIDSIVALKEDVSLSYYVDGIIRFGKRINCFSGGGLDWFMVAEPYGATAYFDSYATFAPQITTRFRQAVQRGDYTEQTRIITKYDHPFIQNFSASFWHATLEYFGIAGRYLRPPQHTYTNEEMAQVKQFYDKVGLSPSNRKS